MSYFRELLSKLSLPQRYRKNVADSWGRPASNMQICAPLPCRRPKELILVHRLWWWIVSKLHFCPGFHEGSSATTSRSTLGAALPIWRPRDCTTGAAVGFPHRSEAEDYPPSWLLRECGRGAICAAWSFPQPTQHDQRPDHQRDHHWKCQEQRPDHQRNHHWKCRSSRTKSTSSQKDFERIVLTIYIFSENTHEK
jgi:hypothetical protein